MDKNKSRNVTYFTIDIESRNLTVILLLNFSNNFIDFLLKFSIFQI